MRLYDTARRAVVPFEPGPLVKMYTCGITPYDATHVGHAATYVLYDVLQRRLRDLGHETQCVRNITDVDDDMLRKAREVGMPYLELAAAEVARFQGDMRALNVLPAFSEPAATSAIHDILDEILWLFSALPIGLPISLRPGASIIQSPDPPAPAATAGS